MICADSENILVPGDNGEQSMNEFHSNKYQKHVSCSYGYKLVCTVDTFIKPFKYGLGEGSVTILLIVWLEKVSTAVK